MDPPVQATTQGVNFGRRSGVNIQRRLTLDDAVERLEQLEDATDRLLRALDHEVGRRRLSLQLKLQMETVEQLLDVR